MATRCHLCGLLGCKHMSSPYRDSDPINELAEQKKILLKELYKASDIAASTYNIVQCNVCKAKIYTAYLDAHLKTHYPNDDDDKPLTVEESLSKLTKGCEGCQGDDACCAIAGLKAAGWDVQINPAIAHGDRKGYQITILEPKKEESNVQSAKEK